MLPDQRECGVPGELGVGVEGDDVPDGSQDGAIADHVGEGVGRIGGASATGPPPATGAVSTGAAPPGRDCSKGH